MANNIVLFKLFSKSPMQSQLRSLSAHVNHISFHVVFIDSALENFEQMKPRDEVAENDYGVRLYIMLKYSKSPVTEFLSTFIVVCPHSMTVERGVSTYNLLHSKQQQSFPEDTLVDRLLIHWNKLPTAHYDPRPWFKSF